MANLLFNILTKYQGQGVDKAKKDVGDLQDILKKGAALFGVSLGAREIIKFGIATVEAGEQARVAATSFENLSGSANIARVNLAAMDRATKGLISDTQEMQIANQLLGMNIVQTGGQLEEVVGVSRRLGKEFKGLGAREAAEEFAIMIANMSVARLDSFGLSSSNVRKRIEELMATTEGMTREQAFFQATMEEGQKTMDRLGPEVATTADEVSRLGAEWGNFQAFLGQTISDSGLVTSFFSSLADGVITLRNLLGDEDMTNQVAALKVEIAQTEAELAKAREHSEDFVFGPLWKSDIPGYEEKLKDLQGELANLEAEQQKVIEAGEKEQEQLQARIRSEEIAAENLAKRTEAEKKFGEVQKEFGREIVDLQRQTDDELKDLQDRFVDDSLEAEEKHVENIADIREKAAKDAVKDAKRLQKDLAKVDTSLKKDLIKQQLDEDKQIAKLQEKAGKEEVQSRRRKQIDAAGDERLFQFELRQLAAEGQGNAIKEALERREIEKQIASEKAEFEKQVESQKKDDAISTIREEGRERRAQLEEQAADRRADLELRAQEETAERAERLAEEIADEGEAYADRKDDLKEFLAEQTEATQEGEQKRIEEIARGLSQVEEMTNTQFDRLVALAGEFGPKVGEAFADGLSEGFSDNVKLGSALGKAGSALGAGAGPLPSAAGSSQPATRAGTPIFAGGGVMGRSGFAHLEEGEVVANPSIGQAIVIGGEQFAVHEAARLAAVINAQRQRDIQQLVDELSERLN